MDNTKRIEQLQALIDEHSDLFQHVVVKNGIIEECCAESKNIVDAVREGWVAVHRDWIDNLDEDTLLKQMIENKEILESHTIQAGFKVKFIHGKLRNIPGNPVPSDWEIRRKFDKYLDSNLVSSVNFDCFDFRDYVLAAAEEISGTYECFKPKGFYDKYYNETVYISIRLLKLYDEEKYDYKGDNSYIGEYEESIWYY